MIDYFDDKFEISLQRNKMAGNSIKNLKDSNLEVESVDITRVGNVILRENMMMSANLVEFGQLVDKK